MDLPERAMPPFAADGTHACAGVDTEIFFPTNDAGAAPAVAICNRCDHQDECLQWALDTRQGWGVLGGKTAGQRAAILRERRYWKNREPT